MLTFSFNANFNTIPFPFAWTLFLHLARPPRLQNINDIDILIHDTCLLLVSPPFCAHPHHLQREHPKIWKPPPSNSPRCSGTIWPLGNINRCRNKRDNGRVQPMGKGSRRHFTVRVVKPLPTSSSPRRNLPLQWQHKHPPTARDREVRKGFEVARMRSVATISRRFFLAPRHSQSSRWPQRPTAVCLRRWSFIRSSGI